MDSNHDIVASDSFCRFMSDLLCKRLLTFAFFESQGTLGHSGTCKMASLYKRSRSPFWWIKWRDERGKIQRESLCLRIGIGSETKRAREIRAERTLKEAKAATSVSRRGDKQDLVMWVPEWFRVRYSNSPLTLTKYQESWHAISAFFEERKIKRAEQVHREDVISFVEWRQKPSSPSVRASSRNTALHDLKVLRAILYEALRRGWANQNAAARLGLKADRSREKPEFTASKIAERNPQPPDAGESEE